MVADGRAFGISVGIYSAISVGCLLFFGVFRKSRICKKFYAPKRYMKGKGAKPRRLPTSFWGWIAPVYSASEDEVIRVAGVDAAMYLRLLAFGCELFLGVALWCALTVLPTNAGGGKAIAHLEGQNVVAPSPYTYWVSPPPPANMMAAAPPSPAAIKSPTFYDTDPSPPAPPGLKWFKYQDGVPTLPPITSVLGPTYRNFTWMYDQNFVIRSYSFSNLDMVTMSNIEPRSNLYWVHLLTIWVVTFYTFSLLWRYSREAVQMRLRYLQTDQGTEAYTVLVQDIPGVQYGTPLHRLDSTVLAVLPDAVKAPIKRAIGKAVEIGEKGVHATAGKLANTLVTTRSHAASGVQRTATGGERFYDPPETLSRINSGASLGTAEGGAPNPKDPEAQETGWQPRKTVEPEIANAVPKPEQAWQSITSTNAWGQARELLGSGLTMQQMVEREMAALFPGDVQSVHSVYDTAKLDSLTEEYEKLHGNLTDLLDDYTSKKRRHKKFKRKTTRVVGVKYGQWGREKYGVSPAKVDAMEFYVARLEELRRLIHQEQQAAKHSTVPSAFVTFKRCRAQVTAVSTTQHSDTTAWRVSAAPHFNELLWKNLRWRAWERSVRSLAVWGAFVCLALFYLIPIGAVQGLLAVDVLDRNPVLHFILHAPVLDSLITAILPSLVLRIFLALLPILLRLMGRVQGLYSQSMLDFSVVTKYYIFQIITVFFGTLIAGSIASQIKVFVEQPYLFLQTLGTAAPLTSIFFLTYVELNALAITPISFLNPVALVLFWVMSFFAATERAKARLWQNQFMLYGSKVPMHTITILLGLTFCCMNPLLPAMCLVYFLINSLTEKYNMMYVMRANFQSGGRIWTMFFYQVIVALIIFQLSMLALLFLKLSIVPAVLVIPLIPITLLFMLFCSAIFTRPFQVLSLRAAVDLDEYRQMMDHGAHKAGAEYLAPAFKFDEHEHKAVLQEAATMDRVLSGHQAVHHTCPEDDDDDDATSVASAAGATQGRPAAHPAGHGEP
ncbi:hypothetical protein WJX81_004889 [Elliptochloris bilobata]|uniref:Uncharacterized protein n=1 Tax=Elliptochloris bilobata TaxID=381761 RepID=A0AAW1S428_9CHLO